MVVDFYLTLLKLELSKSNFLDFTEPSKGFARKNLAPADTTFILTENPMLKLHKLFKLPLLKINITNLIQKVLFEYHF